MRVITIQLDNEMDQYHEDISKFLELMVHKLHKNVHKGRWEGMDVWTAYSLLVDEVHELEAALLEHNRDEVLLEAADAANFAMIIASIVRELGNDTGIRRA